MLGIFVDADYCIALLNPSDQFHEVAVRVSRGLDQPLFTTTWILVEAADALGSPHHRRVVHRFLEEAPARQRTVVIPADATWYALGLALYGARPDKGWSLTDCINFELMAEFGLTEALTANHHFEQAGFRASLKQP